MDLDLELIDRTVASLHEQDPAFDWAGVYFVDIDSNRPDAFGEREVRLVGEAAQEIAASA